MKKMFNLMLLGLGALCLAARAADSDDSTKGTSDVSGQTFFRVRPPFQAASPEQISGFRGRGLMRDCGMGGAVQVVPFGGQSTNQKALGRFFSICQKDSLQVAADGATGITPFSADLGIGRDVNPEHFGIITATPANNAFKSTISFRPQQTFAGVGIEWRQYVGWCDFWFDVSFPIEWVKNKVNLDESNVTAAGTLLAGAPANMIQAFTGQYGLGLVGTTAVANYKPWVGGIIDDSKKHTKAGVADIELKFGMDYLDTECAHADAYVGVLIPTGNKPHGYYVFEPIIGDNGHVGIITGGSYGYNLWDGDCDRELWLTIDMNSRYEFKNTQTRSFDVCDKSWSRYQAVYATQADAVAGVLTPGINVFTKRVNVSPRFWHNYTIALAFNQCSFQAEVGYNFFARQAEKVTLKNAWVSGPAFASIDAGAVGATANASINHAITIAANLPLYAATYDATAVTNGLLIQQSDLNLNSAAMPAQLSHTVYGSLGYSFDLCSIPVFAGFGGSYEFSGVNTVLNRWMAWGKLGISF